MPSSSRVRAALIADVVGSRGHPDRSELHERLTTAFAAPRVAGPALHGPAITVGDEFQATYPRLGDALLAAYDLRLDLLPGVDVRVGLGVGDVLTLGDEPGAQDGSAWWTARSAIEEVEARSRRAATRTARVAYATRDQDAPSADTVAAALGPLDQLIGGLDERSLRLLRGLREGRTQAELADREQVSASAVSQRVRTAGLAVIATAVDDLARIDAPAD